MVLKKYKAPLNIFICFEKINSTFFTSDVLYNNHYIIFTNSKFYYGLNVFIKNDLFLNFLNLTEISIVDTLKYNNINDLEMISKNKRYMQFNLYNCYFNKIRLTLIININKKIFSIDKLFNNAVWLERESSEMFNIQYINKLDNRSLLLDYSKNEYPLLKDFPCEGFYEIYFDFFENKLNYIKSEIIEL